MKKKLRFFKVFAVLNMVFVTIVGGNMAVEHFADIDFETTKMALEATIIGLLFILIGGILIIILNGDE